MQYSSFSLPKFPIAIIFFIGFFYIFYSLEFSPGAKPPIPSRIRLQKPKPEKTTLKHIVFGIAASSDIWEHRKNYIKAWWSPKTMNGVVWLDKPVRNDRLNDPLLPEKQISSDTSKFRYKNKKGHRSAVRISRVVSETLKYYEKKKRNKNRVRWFVMGDDDTMFVADNLVRVLSKYDHNDYYYIGSSSESHLQNIYFSYGMAFGGGGFAISYPLAKALSEMQDRCIQRYPLLYGSDDRIHACMAELGVPLTKVAGFHQLDFYNNIFGFLAAHPVTPILSLHHFDVIDPIFPGLDRVQSLQKLRLPMTLDSAALMQQSICYDKSRYWTVSVSWGYAVQIIRGKMSVRDMEKPARTFMDWYRRGDFHLYPFNTGPIAKTPCQKPFIYYLNNATYNPNVKMTASEYHLYDVEYPKCNWRMADPSRIKRVKVLKKPDPNMWDRAPRRNCCRVLEASKNGTMLIDVGACRVGEIVE